MRQTCKMERVIRYLCKKGMTPKEIHEDFMKTLGNESSYFSTVKKNGLHNLSVEESIEDDARSGRPKDENVEIVYNLVMCDRR